MATAKPPADLGPRSELLIDKHVEYILSFTKIWEVRGERREGGGDARRARLARWLLAAINARARA